MSRRKLEMAWIVARQYKNWPSVIFHLALRRPMKVVKLRGGRTISSHRPIDINCYLYLSILLNAGWEVVEIDDKLILLRDRGGVEVKCRYTRGYDLGHLVEIFIDKCYGDHFAEQNVIDVGASNGDSALYFAMMGAKRVVGFEPYLESYSLALENIKKNGFSDVVSLSNTALAPARGNLELKISSKSPNVNSSSPTSYIRSLYTFDEGNVVEAIVLDDVVRNFGSDQIDLLKMDCEGCEYGVLNSVSPNTLRRIKEIRIEFHDGSSTISQLLIENGFAVHCEGGLTGYIHAIRDY